MPVRDDWKAWAAPWKLPISVGGMRNSAITALTLSIAWLSDKPGLRLKDSVTAGNCPWWLTVSGLTPLLIRATADNGTSAPAFERT